MLYVKYHSIINKEYKLEKKMGRFFCYMTLYYRGTASITQQEICGPFNRRIHKIYNETT